MRHKRGKIFEVIVGRSLKNEGKPEYPFCGWTFFSPLETRFGFCIGISMSKTNWLLKGLNEVDTC